MSEAPDTNPASLYPPDGGAAAAEAAQAATQTAPAGADTTPAAAGNDSISAAAGNDSVSGTETQSGPASEAAAAGNDSIQGGAGNDSITADSYQFTLPEGFTEDAGLQTEARAAFLDAGVNPAKAQALIDLFGKTIKAANEKAAGAFQAEQTSWLQEISSMPEFQGPTRETSLQSIGRLFDEYGSPEAKAALNRGGIGNNPALAKMMLKIANALTEGAPARPGGVPPNGQGGKRQPQTVGQSLYPDA